MCACRREHDSELVEVCVLHTRFSYIYFVHVWSRAVSLLTCLLDLAARGALARLLLPRQQCGDGFHAGGTHGSSRELRFSRGACWPCPARPAHAAGVNRNSVVVGVSFHCLFLCELGSKCFCVRQAFSHVEVCKPNTRQLSTVSRTLVLVSLPCARMLSL